MESKRLMGKKSRAQGLAFEKKVRSNLEKEGYICDRWTNNVSDYPENNINLPPNERGDRKLISAKSNRFRMRNTGFPDFIVYTWNLYEYYKILGIECKMNGKLDKIEKEKCEWLLKNHIFSKIYIASKGIKRGEIIYKKFTY